MIAPVSFNPPNLTLACSVCGWRGTVTIASLAFAVGVDGSANVHYIDTPCGNPADGSVSRHPVGGGAHPRAIQALFILKLMDAQGLTFLQAKAAVKAAAEAMDGAGRFQLDAVTAGDLPNSITSS